MMPHEISDKAYEVNTEDLRHSKKYTDRIKYLDSIIGQALHQFQLDTGVRLKQIYVNYAEDGTFHLGFDLRFEVATKIHGGNPR